MNMRPGIGPVGQLGCQESQAESKDFAETEQENPGEQCQEHPYDGIEYTTGQVHL